MKKSSKFIFFILLIIFFDSNLFSATIGSDDFTDGTLNGWSGGTGVSVVSQQLHIEGTYSATKTYSFGPEDANKSVAINLQATTAGGWRRDDLIITANGTQYTQVYEDVTTYDFPTIFVTLDGNGNLTLAINPATRDSSTTIDIDNIDIYDDPDNSTKVHFDFSNPNLRDFTLYHQDSIVGNMQIIGNSVKLDTGGTCAPLTTNNNDLTTIYADIDSDPNTYNSTSADLVLPPEVTSSNILYALLYWQGRTNGGSDLTNAKTVKIKPFGASSYQTITTLNTKFNWNSSEYQGSADVTALIKTSIDSINPATINLTGYNEPLWVADVYAPVASNGYGAWSLVIAYKDLSAKLRNISVYDGYQRVYNNTFSTTLGGFLTPRYGPVDSKFVVFAAEGDISLTDSVSIADKNGNPISLGDNIFRSAEDIFGKNVTNRNPACANTIGSDIRTFSVGTKGNPAIMGNSQTSTTVDLISTGDEYFPGLFVFSTELYQPDICYDEELTFNGQKISNTNQPPRGAQISAEVTITNKQYEAAKGVSVQKIFSPYDGLTYVPGSTNIAPIPGTTYPDANLTDAIGDDTAEFSTDTNTSTYFLGIGATATQGGSVALGDYTNIKYQAKISDENVSENRYLVSYRNDFLNLSFSGVPLRKCSDFNNEFSAYAPVDIFNVVHSGFTGTIDPLNNKLPGNALYTQVVNRSFKVDVLALDLDKTTLKAYTGDLNISIIKTPKYTNCADDICKQLICDDEVPITDWQDVPFNNQAQVRDIGFTFPKAIQDASFKVRYTDSWDNVLYVCSRDRFAVRPDRFILTTGEDKDLLTSAKDYNFTLIAVDVNKVASIDYNVSDVNASVFDLNQTLYSNDYDGTIGTDMNGTLNFSATPFNIINGQSSNDVGINFNDVGKVDINLTDKTWAQIDIDIDTNDTANCSPTGAYVCGDINATFIPDHFTLEHVELHDYNDSNFTYVSTDLSMSAYVSVTITAQNFLNKTTLNFSSDSWENPVDVNLSVSAPDGRVSVKDDIHTTSYIGFVDGTIAIENDKNSSKNIKFNFKRNASKAHEPFKVPGGDVNLTAKSTYTSSSGLSKDINGWSNTGAQNTTFYYGRVHAPDYRFKGDVGNAIIYYEVYCKDCNKTDFNINGKESVDSINWYNNMLHADNGFGQYDPSPTYDTIITNTSLKSMDLKHPAPYKDKINFNSSSWLKYNPTDFLVEFSGVGTTWAGQGDLGKTVDRNVSTIQNKRIDW